MAIYRHPDGTYHRHPPTAPAKPAADYGDDANWCQVPGAEPGVQIHRDGKTMRNTAPTPPKA